MNKIEMSTSIIRLTYSLKIMINIERCADMAVKRAKIPFAESIWKNKGSIEKQNKKNKPDQSFIYNDKSHEIGKSYLFYI